MPTSPNVTLSPQQIAIREAVKNFSGLTGVNAATISLITEKFVGLIAGRWDHLCDVAIAEDAGGKVNVGFSLGLDMTHKCPVGKLSMSFALRTKDDTEFQVDDPSQGTLPFAQIVRDSAASDSDLPTPTLAPPPASTPTEPTELAPTPRTPRRRRAVTAQAA